ncbi:MAG: hypothetical protein JWQ28_1535 [Pedobacter sp.]|jgi:hypothetical protein|nr:hypothetical protein [Pedobacter sp.]
MKTKRLLWIIFAGFAIIIGLYPLVYLSAQMRNQGLLQTKPAELIQSKMYFAAFYTHITFGGIALLLGWSQFSSEFRVRYLKTHRVIGTIYVFSVVLSALAGFSIALFATGGPISSAGFMGLALCWLFTIFMAYRAILNKDLQEHENWMIRNYALAFAAVTLRLWLPFSQLALHMDFDSAYRIISWLCWVPNLVVAELIVRRKRLPLLTTVL